MRSGGLLRGVAVLVPFPHKNNSGVGPRPVLRIHYYVAKDHLLRGPPTPLLRDPPAAVLSTLSPFLFPCFPSLMLGI